MAQGWIEPLIRPAPLPQAPRVERVRTSVTVRVTDGVARVAVEEWFRNNGTGLAEGDYIYPLAGEAVFSDFSLMQGEEVLKGEPMDAARARAIYEEIVRRHRDPALIELAGHGLIRARVFPIAAGETRSVTLRFTQVLSRSGDAYRFRYVAGARQRVAAPSPRPVPTSDAAPIAFTLIAEAGNRFGEPFSPTHRLRASRDGQRLVVRPEEQVHGSVDIFLPLAGPAVGISLATHRVDNEDGYFMLTLSPGRAQGTPNPRDVAVVVDTSGSMSGEKMEQARQALHRLLGTLNATDRFRLIAFSNRVEAQRPEWTTATRAAVDEARGWVDRLSAGGGTNISGALDDAFRTAAGEGRLHMVIFITDGLPTIGETDPDRIAARLEAARREARIFTFGVGYDLHTYLLERMATAGRGAVDYVEPGADVEEAVGSLAAKISHPVLVDLAFAGSPARLKDLHPGRLPDLFAGEELVVFGRYEVPAGQAAGELSIAGMRSGRREQFASRVDFPAHAASGDYIPGLWAARKIGELMRTIRVEGETPQRVAEVRDLALRYGLLTEYTSYLVQEPGVLANRVRDGIAAPAAAPVMVTGQSAVASAKLAATRREAQTAADMAAAERAMERMASPGSGSDRVVAGRRFRQESGSWIDAGHSGAAKVLHVAPFSRAYFDLLAKLPELKPYVTAFDAVTIAGGGISIRIAPGGRSSLTAAERDDAASAFRGTGKTR
jgi:Ca-activated chloride channel family protein